MSMAIKRASYTGDPGFFDIFKKVAAVGTSFIPVVGGTISQAISSIGTRGPTVAGPGSVPTGGHQHHVRSPGHEPHGELARSMRAAGTLPAAGFPAMVQRAVPGGQTGMMAPPTMNGSMAGYHVNKSDYFLKSGEYVPAGTRWVRNRKRNPANARATSRAISRVVGAKRYAKSLGRITVRKHHHAH